MNKIIASVGRNGKNRSVDVVFIQKLLNAHKNLGELTPLIVDGKVGNKTISRIEAFQKNILKITRPDGRIDPNGKTFKKLVNDTSIPDVKDFIKFSFKGINLLKSIEQLATTPYDDQTGKDITVWVAGATIGYGHLISSSEWSKYKKGITQVEALKLFHADLRPYINTVKTKIAVNVTQNEFDAMVVFTFNIGRKGFSNSSVLKIINNHGVTSSYSNLETAWKAWNKSQGKINKGLINRRKAEWNIYSKGVYRKW